MKNIVLGVMAITLCMAVQAKYLVVGYNQPDQQDLPAFTQDVSVKPYQQQILHNKSNVLCSDQAQVNTTGNACVVN